LLFEKVNEPPQSPTYKENKKQEIGNENRNEGGQKSNRIEICKMCYFCYLLGFYAGAGLVPTKVTGE
jgi:hypothetical protein